MGAGQTGADAETIIVAIMSQTVCFRTRSECPLSADAVEKVFVAARQVL